MKIKSIIINTLVTTSSRINSRLKTIFSRSAIADKDELLQIRNIVLNLKGGRGDTISKVKIGTSSALASGQGVFANRNISQGEVITLYAGILFPQPPFVTGAVNDDSLVPKPVIQLPKAVTNDYIINLGESGTGYLDGFEALNVGPLSCAQIINHPPIHTEPNVVMIEYKYDELLTVSGDDRNYSSDDNYRDENGMCKTKLKEVIRANAISINQMYQGLWYVNESGQPINTPYQSVIDANDNENSTTSSYNTARMKELAEWDHYWSLMAGVGMVAKKDIAEGEELWFDYELALKDLSPEVRKWYNPVPFKWK